MGIYLNPFIYVPGQSITVYPVVYGSESDISIIRDPSSSNNDWNKNKNSGYYKDV